MALRPIESGALDAVRQSIGSLVRHPIEGLREKVIPASDSGEYYALEIPQSPFAPHQVLGTGTYYRREGAGNVPMSHDIVELHFGRRLGPVLELTVDLRYLGPDAIDDSGFPIPVGSRAYDVSFSLRNVGRHAARHPHLLVRLLWLGHLRLIKGNLPVQVRQSIYQTAQYLAVSKTDNESVIYVGPDHQFLTLPLIVSDNLRGRDLGFALVDVYADGMAARRSTVWLEDDGKISTTAKVRTEIAAFEDRAPVSVVW